MGLIELTKEVPKNTKTYEIINKLQDNIVDLKDKNDKLRSDNIELKESMLCTEYIAKKKNLILNGVSCHPKNGVKMKKIVKDLF